MSWFILLFYFKDDVFTYVLKVVFQLMNFIKNEGVLK